MSNGTKNNKGTIGNKGGGRKSKADEDKVNTIFSTALKQLYKKDTDDEAKIEFVKSLLDSQRGQIFVAGHVFGMPKNKVEVEGSLVVPILNNNPLGNG